MAFALVFAHDALPELVQARPHAVLADVLLEAVHLVGRDVQLAALGVVDDHAVDQPPVGLDARHPHVLPDPVVDVNDVVAVRERLEARDGRPAPELASPAPAVPVEDVVVGVDDETRGRQRETLLEASHFEGDVGGGFSEEF